MSNENKPSNAPALHCEMLLEPLGRVCSNHPHLEPVPEPQAQLILSYLVKFASGIGYFST